MNTDFSAAPMVRVYPRPALRGCVLPETLSGELARAKESDRCWFDRVEDSRLEAGACDVETARSLAAEAPSPFLSGWLAAMVAQMLVRG